MTKPVLNYKELSIFLLNESVRMTEEFLEDLNEENGEETPFYFCGPERVIKQHQLIGEYLKYAVMAYELWQPFLKKDAQS